MIPQVLETLCVLIAVGAASRALFVQPGEDAAQARMQKAGVAGERRVARTLDRARIPAVHDVTISDGRGTHQIDHVAAAGDVLWVIETKSWRGDLSGHHDAPTWLLMNPQKRVAARIYNPIMQNETHADVIRLVARVPVQSIVIMAGHVRMPGGLPEPIMPLAGAVLRMTQAGPPSSRALAGLAEIERIKQAAGQGSLASQHIRRMRRMKPAESRKLWAAAGVAMAGFIWMMVTHPR